MDEFIIKHYSKDERPIIKGNGFDGLEIGEDRKDAEEFIEFINQLIRKLKSTHANSPDGVRRSKW